MTKSARLAWLISVTAIAGASGMLAFLLSISTTAQRGFLERHYVWLFWVNVAVATALIIVIGVAGTRLALRVKRARFGSRLLLKLAGIFAIVGVVPGLLIYTVSYQFVNRSIESLFDQRLASALEAGLALGQDTLENLRAEQTTRTRAAAERWEDGALAPLALERLRDQLGARSVALVAGNGQVVLSAGGESSEIPARPSAALISQARSNGIASRLEGLEDEQLAMQGEARIRSLALLPSSALQLTNSDRYLMVVKQISGKVISNALNVSTANQEYLQRSLLRDGLRRMYLGTLTLVLILAVFAALLLAVALSNQLVQPLLLLAEGMREVATGDLKAKPVFRSRDELGGLTQSFADMTQQLADARALVELSVTQLERARTHVQTILDNLTAGVIVFDGDRHIETVNPGATRILKLPLSAYVGRELEELPALAAFSKDIWQRFELQSSESGEREHWQDSFELQLDEKTALTLLVRGALLPQDARLLVFDDISEVVSAQRS
ncbi:HAMP domain-containing protein, partial [Mitsuaria sp. CC2]|uniref:sensor histidine kinase n=1 Tax=Mitsuaria sp. CC2 TaxID=3029186 RepID=UPI003B8DB79C